MNILIIDDEPAIAQNVLRQVTRLALPEISRVDCVNSTAAARQRMNETSYDLFLCDIVMPEEDGISFARNTLSRMPFVKFIFLTAHADYEYMKSAISLHSFDYLLQPADDAEMRDVIVRAMEEIHIERKNAELLDRGSFAIHHEEAMLEEKASAYLSGREEDPAYLEELMSIKLTENVRHEVTVPFIIDILSANEEFVSVGKDLLNLIYYNILGEVLTPLSLELVLVFRRFPEVCCLLFAPDTGFPETARLKDTLESLCGFFGKLVETRIRIYGEEESPVEDVRQAVMRLEEASANDVTSRSQVVFLDREGGQKTEFYSFDPQIRIWKNLINTDFRRFSISLSEYLDVLLARRSVDRDFLLRLHQALTELLLNYMVSNNVDSAGVFDDELPYFTFMNSYENLEGFCRDIRHILGRLSETGEADSQDAVDKAVRYIREHIETPLPVTEVADYVGMNPQYLTKLFRRRTGMGLKEYITDKKIEDARLLLETTSLSVAMISEHVGYENYANFLRAFRQSAGCTPLEYRAAKMQEKR